MATGHIPLVPQWNLTGGCVCTPDGGFLYVGMRSINYIGKTDANAAGNEVPLVKAFHTRQNILSLDIDPAWPKELGKAAVGDAATMRTKRLFAILAQDNSIQIWDFDKENAISGHKAHFNITRYLEGRGPSHGVECLMSYMSNSSVLSLSAQDLVVYCVASNSYCRRSSFLPSRGNQFTIMHCSPYNEHIFAVGSARGLVMVCDLQKMQVVYTLRGHDAAITSLSWNVLEHAAREQPVQKTEQVAAATVKVRKAELKKQKHSIDTDDIFDIYDYEYLDNEFGAPASVERKKSDDDETAQLTHIDSAIEATSTANFDFVEACMSLKQDIDALNNESPMERDDSGGVTLEDCKQAKNVAPSSPSCSNESTEGSLELIDRSSSDEGVDVDGVERKPKPQVLMMHQAEVHATQTNEQEANSGVAVDDIKTDEQNKQEDMKASATITNCDNCTNKHNVQENLSTPVQQQPTITLLASASIDSNYWVWNATTGAACDNWTMRCMNGPGVQGRNTHIEIAWLQATKLITSNKHGDLAIRSIKPQKDGAKTCFKFVDEKRNFSQRGVVAFDIGKCPDAHFMWSITSNREVICEDLRTQVLVAKYCCASTNINAMRESPDDMNKIALGFSDRRIGILDISQLSKNNVHIENFSQKIDSAVLSIVWSPDSKRLAFGTLEGRVGILNVENPKQQIITYNPMSGKPVYSIDWQGNNIFVICYDNLGIYDTDGKSKDAVVVKNLGVLSAISVRDRFMFLGTRDGHVKIYTPAQQPSSGSSDGDGQTTRNWTQLTLVQELQLFSRYITAFDWSPLTNLCAVACNENKIAILDFNAETQQAVVKRHIRIKHTKASNGCIKWSNCDENLFVTSGFDGYIRVWDLRNEKDEEKYAKHFHCPMFCVLFLPTDENIIVCTGKSTSVEFIDMRVESTNGDTKRSSTHALDNVQWATKMLLSHENNAVPKSAKEKRRQQRDLEGVDLDVTKPNEATVEQPSKDQAVKTQNKTEPHSKTEIAELLENLQIDAKQIQNSNSNNNRCSAGENCVAPYMKIPTTLLHLTTKELNKDSLQLLHKLLSNKNIQNMDNKTLCFKLFGTKAQASNLLKNELDQHHQSGGKGISQIFMPQLTSNLKDEFIKCIQKRTLTAWHIAMAPSISYGFWQKCCQAYAEQLLEQGYAVQAASYMLALHKQCEAIDMLMQRQYFKEALLLARIYLQPKDILLNNIIDKWITYLDFTGNLTGAALLCALSGQLNRAHETLLKFRNPPPEIENILQLIKPTQ